MAESTLRELIEKVLDNEAQIRARYAYKPPVPGKPATEAQIAAFEKRIHKALPPSYKIFLKMHDGVEGFWGDFSLVGTSGPTNTKLINRIELMVRIDTDETVPALANDEDIESYEKKGQYYLPRHFVFGTDMGRGLLLYDANSRDSSGEVQVVMWRADQATHPKFADLEQFLRSCLNQQDEMLASAPAKSDKPATQPAPAPSKSSRLKPASRPKTAALSGPARAKKSLKRVKIGKSGRKK